MMKKGFIILLALTSVIGFFDIALGESKDEAVRLYDQGQKAHQAGEYKKALSYFNRSLEMSKKLDVPALISVNLNEIGTVYKTLGMYNEALNSHKQALKIREKLKVPEAVATSLNNIGEVYRIIGRYNEALEYFNNSLKIVKQLKIPQRVSQNLNNIGTVYYHTGQYGKALEYYAESLAMSRELNAQQDIASICNNIGAVYHSLGRYDEALSSHKKALNIRKKQKKHLDIAASLNNIGTVYESLGRYDEALDYFHDSLNILKEIKIPTETAATLNNIGLVYAYLGLYDKTLEYYGKALEIVTELNNHSRVATTLNNIGYVHVAKKNFQKAEEIFKSAEKEIEKTGFKRTGTPGLVEVYVALGRYDKAMEVVLEMTPVWFDSDQYRIRYHTEKGRTLKGIGMLKEASMEFLEAVSLIEDMRQLVKSEKTGFLGASNRLKAYKGLVSALCERVLNGEKEDKNLKQVANNLSSAAFYFSESTKARVLLEAMAKAKRIDQRFGVSQELKIKEESLISQLSAINSQWEKAYKSEDFYKELKKKKAQLTVQLNNLIRELREKYPRYATLCYPKPLPPEELPLKEKEVILEFAVGDDASYLFLVRKGGVEKIFRIPVKIEDLGAKIASFMEPMNTLDINNFSVKIAKELYDILLSRPLRDIKTNEKIIIIPDGILGLLPFEALVMEEGSGVADSLYVGDNYYLSYYQSATILAFQRTDKVAKAKRPLFALGNPVFDENDPRYIAFKEGKTEDIPTSSTKEEFAYRGLAIKSKWGKTSKNDKKGRELFYPPLPETEEEVRTIAGLFNIQTEPPDILLGVLANETSLRKSPLEKYRYIHFATHADSGGMVQGIEEPFILLGMVENRGKDDGFLTLREVFDLNLCADLVVISACLTGRGKVMEGEGISSFARAFQYAGARTILISLWELSSLETVEYMKNFYSYLKTGKDKMEALRRARTEMKLKYPNPFYWAVFVLHGEV
jgi:CHAT domain-containing protein/Tfp pilus assembly protein PilF